MRMFLLLLILFTYTFAECYYKFETKKYVKTFDYEQNCKGKYFIRICSDIDLEFCSNEIREECFSLIGKNAGDRCRISDENPYDSNIETENMNEILYNLSSKGRVYVSKKDSVLKKLFTAKYQMHCNLQGNDGGEYGDGVFISDKCLLFHRNVEPTW
ncbi:MAG: hypothetical protein HUK21_11945 [Fibrobacteraceae bacterium]|nr:hypothetical protein [Fibrobacteraceae bacterium]